LKKTSEPSYKLEATFFCQKKIFNIRNVAHNFKKSIVLSECNFQWTHSLNELITLHYKKRQNYTQVLILYFSSFKEKDNEYSFLDPPHFILTKDSKKVINNRPELPEKSIFRLN
jgi:hypothetical protein